MNKPTTTHLQTPVTRDCEVVITFDGNLTSLAIDRLIQYLTIMREGYEADEKAAETTPAPRKEDQ